MYANYVCIGSFSGMCVCDVEMFLNFRIYLTGDYVEPPGAVSLLASY